MHVEEQGKGTTKRIYDHLTNTVRKEAEEKDTT